MPIIYASSTGNTDDVSIWKSGIVTTWAAARDATSGSSATDAFAATANATAVYGAFVAKAGSNIYSVYRSFLVFDTSGITGTVASAEISIWGRTRNTGSAIVVKSDAYGGDGGTNWSTSDFNNIVGWSAGSSLDGLATVYGAAKTTTNWSTSGWNDFTATSDLLADIKNNDVVIVCLMDYTNDYLNVAPSLGSDLGCGAYFAESSYKPHLDYTLATGYGNSVNGVSAASIGKINGIATASIEKVNGI